ncbi:PHP domain-containing protein [Halalkalibacter oceani]|uniref:PHP domain-containing protein n=1 Tax=Halalkalibacter oceani TaxID=1653776 RepID=UPI0033954A9A
MRKTAKNADLHLHSTASDGGYSPSELMKKCSRAGLDIVALTDHDTVGGIDEARQAGQELGITVIPGIEFSTTYQGKSIHILGYAFDWKDEALQLMLAEQKELRQERLHTMLSKLAALGLSLTPEQVLRYVDGGSVGRPHLAKALIDAGYVGTVAEAFDRYLAEGKPAYVEKSKELSVKEAIDRIHQTDGIAVVAHPLYYDKDEDIKMWVSEWGLDGIEVYHRDHDEEAVTRYLALVNEIEREQKKTLYVTGGSDFHHEEYGRVLEPLGVTRLDTGLAEKVVALQR